MASPPHDLVHTLVDKHGLQAVCRLMMKPRAHIAAPTAGLIRSTRSPSPGSTRETVWSRKTATKFDSLPEAASISKILPSTFCNNVLGNAATPPTGFALTTQQERRLYGPKPKRGALMPRTINETSSLLLHMRPIIVKRELSVRYSSQQRSAGSEESVESEQQRVVSPNLSATTTTSPSHTSASPHAPPCGHGHSSPPRLSVKHTICYRPAPSAQSPTLPARQHVMAFDLDAVEALLSLTSRVPSAQEPLPSLMQSVAEDSQEFNETTGATSNHGAGSSCRSSPCLQSGEASLDEQGHDAATDSIIPARFIPNAKFGGAPGLREASGNCLQHKRTPATRSYARQDADQSDGFPALPRMVPGQPTGVAVGSIETGGVEEAGGHDKTDDNAAQLLLSAAATAAVTLESSLLSRRGRSKPPSMEACGRGSYKCSRCGLPKKGHKCMLSPRGDVAGLLNRGVKADNSWLRRGASDKCENSMPTTTTSSTSASTPVSSALSPSPELSSATTSDSEKLFEGGRGRRQEGRDTEDSVCVSNYRRAGRRGGSRKRHREEALFEPAQLEGSRMEAVAPVTARALSSSPPPLGSSGDLVARGKRAVSPPPRRSRSPVDKEESACAAVIQGTRSTGPDLEDLQGPAAERPKRRRKNQCRFFLPGGVKACDGGHSHEDRFASAPAARTESTKAKDGVAGASSSPSIVRVSVGVRGKTSLLSSQMALFLAGCSSATSARGCKDRGISSEKSDDDAP